jgi:Tfp pilus assembly protein PilO
MRTRVVAVGVLLGIVVLLIWNLLIFAPKGRTLSKVKKDAAAAQQLESQLRTQLTRLQEISHNGPEIAADLDKLSSAVPASPDLDGFILSANQIAVKSGVDWQAVSPSVAQAGVTGPSVIPLTIQVKGGFFQVLDYLNRLEAMSRLVIVDGINLTAAAESTAGDVAATGPPTLSVTLTARMFTLAPPPPPAGTAPGSGSTGSTPSTSSPPASGNSSGETSTTAVVN